MMIMEHKLLVMWAPPRSLSTAFLRVMKARGDLEILHEPLCDIVACGTHEHRRADGGREILSSVAELFEYVSSLRTHRAVFIKETCEFDYEAHLLGSAYMQQARHIFLLRDPARAINSHFHINPQLTSDEVGYRHLDRLLERVREQAQLLPVFIEAERLSQDPASVVERFCRQVGLPYLPESLSWEKGHLDLWRRTRHWHLEAAESTNIVSSGREYALRVDNHEPLYQLYQNNLPYYERLLAAAREQDGVNHELR